MVATAETISPPESRRQRFFRSGIQIGMCVDCAASPRSSASSLVHNSLVSLGLGGENPLLTMQSAALPQYSRSEVLGSGFWRSHPGNDPVNNLDPSGHKNQPPPQHTFHPPQTQPAQGPNAHVNVKTPTSQHGTTSSAGTSKWTGPTIGANPKRSWLSQKLDSLKIWWQYGHGGFFDQHPMLSHLKDDLIKPVLHGVGEDVGSLVHTIKHPVNTISSAIHGVVSAVSHPKATVNTIKGAYQHFSQVTGDKKIQAVIQQTTSLLIPAAGAKVLAKIGNIAKLAKLGATVRDIDEAPKPTGEDIAKFEHYGSGQPQGIKSTDTIGREKDLGPYRGGPHSQTKLPVGDKLESHHMPSRKSLEDSGIDPEKGPAIQMEPEDHIQTASHGTQGTEGAIYREQIKNLIKQGSVRQAMAREIGDVRRIAGRLYNQAIREMVEYAKSLGLLNKK